MGLERLDLNLLVTLHALLEERNVTRAGQRIGLSQPATSASLARLRRHFDDELLLRVGNGFELTPLAASLVGATSLAVSVVERVFSAKPDFDPATSDREFTLVGSDYVLTVIGGELTRAVEREAPGVRLRFLQINIPRVDDIDTTLRSVDGLLMPHGFITTHPAVDVYTDRWVIIADRDHPDLRDGITMDHLRELPWAVTFQSPTGMASAARQLAMLGVEPRFEVVVENFQSLPFLVPGTRRIALLQERLALRLAAVADVQVLPCPYEVVPVIEAFWYHAANHADAGHRWLREILVGVGERVDRP
ncbi:LysR family transcriptional regulator [Streptosporangium sp. NPDC050855]|uniref:LysR family transcriptional regulator n=1 Tax=Streptosporangium sp. NPDC050855 TaxID=3366194 RepID=UPI0037AAD508